MDFELAAKREQLLTMLAEGEAFLRSGAPLDTLKLGQMRWRFSRAVGTYQRLKHRCWFEPMMAAANPARQAQGRQFSSECLHRGRELQGFFRRWDAAAIRTDADGYRSASLELIARTRLCLREEAEQVEALAPSSAAA